LQPAGPTETFKRNGPGKNIGSFHVKDEEKSGNKIKGDRILKSSRAGWNDATLIRSQLFRVRFFLSEPLGKKEQSDDQDETHQSKKSQSQNPWLPRGKGINVCNWFHPSSWPGRASQVPPRSGAQYNRKLPSWEAPTCGRKASIDYSACSLTPVLSPCLPQTGKEGKGVGAAYQPKAYSERVSKIMG